MNFSQVCEKSGLGPETVHYYVTEKLLNPLFTDQNRPEDAEYASDDVLRLAAIANLRRLRFSGEDIRKILYDPSKAAGLMLKQFNQLKRSSEELKSCVESLEEMDLASFNESGQVINTLAELKLEVDLPSRDRDRDEEARLRLQVNDGLEQNENLHEELLKAEKDKRKWFLLFLLCLFLLLASIGFILGPYIF